MSFEAVKAVYEHSPATDGPDQAVLLALAFHANLESGQAWPAVSTLVRETKYSEATVRRSLTSLEEELGVIVRTVGTHPDFPKDPGRQPVCWVIRLDGYQSDTPVTCDRPGVSERNPRGRTVRPEPQGTSIEPQRNTPAPSAQGSVPFSKKQRANLDGKLTRLWRARSETREDIRDFALSVTGNPVDGVSDLDDSEVVELISLLEKRAECEREYDEDTEDGFFWRR